MKQMLLIGCALLLLALPAGAATVNVSVMDFQFSPKIAMAHIGDVVVWTNVGAVPHTVTSYRPGPGGVGRLFDATLAPGQSLSWVVPPPHRVATIPYLCRFHATRGMTGQIAVTP